MVRETCRYGHPVSATLTVFLGVLPRVSSLASMLAAAVSIAALAAPAPAATVLDTEGFESPLFSTTFDGTGHLEGQPASVPAEIWQKSGAGTSVATVQNSVALTGSQAVQLDRGPNSNDRWGVPLSGLPTSSTSRIVISWNMRVEDAGGPAGSFGPYFGVEAYDASGGIMLLGSFGVDATTGEVLYQATGTGFLTAPGPTVPFGVWNAFKIELDYATQTYSVYLNNAPVVTGIGFVDGALTAFTDADIMGLSAAGDATSMGLTGTAYYDNFLITEECEDTPTPTPTDTPTLTPTPTPTDTPSSTPTSTSRIPLGGDCVAPAECSTEFCVDGVCCDSACGGELERCNLPGQRGTCAGIVSPAPLLSWWGWVAGISLLVWSGFTALRRR
jgi:hypothetical protein